MRDVGLGDVDDDGIRRPDHDGLAVGVHGLLRAEQHSYIREGVSRLRRVLRGAGGFAALLEQFTAHLERRYTAEKCCGENIGKRKVESRQSDLVLSSYEHTAGNEGDVRSLVSNNRVFRIPRRRLKFH